MDSLAAQVADMGLHSTPRAGDTALLSIFTHGNVILLKSIASGKKLRVLKQTQQIKGNGGKAGPHTLFTVHVRRPGVVALQNIYNPEWWLAIYDGKTTATGRGGPNCEFLVGEVEDKFIVLESTMYPGQHVGIFPNGQLKNAHETGTGNHARFIPSIHSQDSAPSSHPPLPPVVEAPPPYSYVPPQQYPPPQKHPPPVIEVPPPYSYVPPLQYPPPQKHPPPVIEVPPQQHPPPVIEVPPQQHPPPIIEVPPQQHPPPIIEVPPQQHPPPPQSAYAGFPPPQQPGYPTPAPPPPAGPQLPLGFNILDAFQNGNIVQLIARSNGYPLQIKNATLYGNGTFTHTDSQFAIIVPQGAAPGVIMMQNVSWSGLHIAICGGRVHGDGGGGKWCQLRVNALPDSYVYFESVHSPGQYLCMSSQGTAGNPRAVGPHDTVAQFFVRVERQKNLYSTTIMTPFGRPSIANQLRDRCVIQLYVKSTHMHIAINNTGYVITTANSGDKHTFFELCDRGMGIYSLHSYLYPGFRLRMANFVLQGKGDPNLNADFRLKENADGTVCFESVTCPNSFVAIGEGAQLQTCVSIFLLNIQKFGGSETITKTPLNC